MGGGVGSGVRSSKRTGPEWSDLDTERSILGTDLGRLSLGEDRAGLENPGEEMAAKGVSAIGDWLGVAEEDAETPDCRRSSSVRHKSSTSTLVGAAGAGGAAISMLACGMEATRSCCSTRALARRATVQY